jgi:NAD(P)-dependent dehydrogenase (short-subunit alcohol dehydrogenase family)
VNEAVRRVAVVTGGASGIGRAIGLALAEDGCAIAIFDRNSQAGAVVASEIEAAGAPARAYEVDVTVRQAVDEAVEDVIRTFGQIDVLINDAGTGYLGRVEDLSEEEWDHVMDVNVKSVFLCSRAVIPHMAAHGGGRIINIASVAGLVASPGRAAYCASKGAVVMLTRAMALDCARRNINVNTICPGVVLTPMTEDTLHDPSEMKRRIDGTPLGRLAEPEEIAPAAVYLAGPGAGFVTGSTLVVDGGWSID